METVWAQFHLFNRNNALLLKILKVKHFEKHKNSFKRNGEHKVKKKKFVYACIDVLTLTEPSTVSSVCLSKICAELSPGHLLLPEATALPSAELCKRSIIHRKITKIKARGYLGTLKATSM